MERACTFLVGVNTATMTCSGLQMSFLMWKPILWQRQNKVVEDLKHTILQNTFFTCFYKFLFSRNQYSAFIKTSWNGLPLFFFLLFFLCLNSSINVWHKAVEQRGCVMTPNMFILETAVFKVLSHVDLSRSRTQSQHKGF